MVNELWDTVDRIDVIYICSNADIARQNINRLNVTPDSQFTLASRITLLPTRVHDLKGRRLNFVSLTPGTSFELKSSLGRQEERALLYWLLERAWSLRGVPALNVLQGNASPEGFRALARSFQDDSGRQIDPTLAEAFTKALIEADAGAALEGQPGLRHRFEELATRFGRVRESVPSEDREARKMLVGELRDLLAATCLRALQPDLIILDEFQRFKHLLDGRDPASALARRLFDYPGARVLLLSATPYKMYTLTDESDDDHYADFVRTVRFLQADEVATTAFETALSGYRRELYRLGGEGGTDRLRQLKEQIEGALRRVMVRTERLALTENRDGMLAEVPSKAMRLEPQDLESYLALQEVARAVDHGDTLDYWKSAPYLLNFMDNYKLKEAVKLGLKDRKTRPAVVKALARHRGGLLPWDDVVKYAQIDPGNARLRSLAADVIDGGAWRLLWVPPSLPYYQLDGPYADISIQAFTKRLVFSSWRVVPRVIASFLSYEAERRMMRSLDDEPENTPEARRRRTPLLRFARADERLTGMPVLGMLYPSATLARACDPLALLGEDEGEGLPAVAAILERAQRKVQTLLDGLDVSATGPGGSDAGQDDETWYWAAPILLDLRHDRAATLEWLGRPDLAAQWSGAAASDDVEESSLWHDHVEQAKELPSRAPLGRAPADLALVLAQMALGAPGVAALRALSRVAGGDAAVSAPWLRDAAGTVAWVFRNLFNTPEVMALVRGLNHEEPYWRRVVEYGVAGGLQSVLDEYVHVLHESLGLFDKDSKKVATEVAEAMRGTLSIRAVSLAVDELRVADDGRDVALDSRRLRARFALRFGDEKAEDRDEDTRADQVRNAFNSPFWPFVLATTSVGQEGLDFHHYCHAVVHWNLPSNPVDLEQREGRVHRYKGHAIRRNIAKRFGVPLPLGEAADPWERLFDLAKAGRPAHASDLVPYWVYPLAGGARIERHVPAFPLSRDLDHLAALRRSLAVYRMIFGQPRQDDLLQYLLARFSGEELAAIMADLRVDLSPGAAGRPLPSVVLPTLPLPLSPTAMVGR